MSTPKLESTQAAAPDASRSRNAIIVWDMRVTRTLVAVVVGAALGVAGALMQAMTRNPLADPGLLGVSAGAGLAVVVATGVFGATSFMSNVWPALFGALVVSSVVYAIRFAAGEDSPTTLILAGVAITSALTGIATALALIDPVIFNILREWMAGSVQGKDMEAIAQLSVFVVLGLIIGFFAARPLSQLALGDALAIVLGDYPIPLAHILPILSGDDFGFANTVVLEWRLPRAVAAVAFGAALGVSGAIFQSITRNPFGSPDVIGFNAGAFTGAVISIGYIGGSQLTTTMLALAGGTATALVVGVLAYRQGVSGTRFVVIGVAVSMALVSINTLLVLRMEQQVATAAVTWGQGDLEDIRWHQVVPMCGILAVVALAAALFTGGMRQLELGDEAARATGVRVEPVRLTLIAAGVALTAVVTSVCGPIAFIALAAPHLARLIDGSPATSRASAAAVGALLLSTCDLAAQHLLLVDLPVGVVTGVVGGAYLLGLVTWKLRRSL